MFTMLSVIALIVALLVVAVLAWLATLEGKYHVTQSRLVNADIDTVFDTLCDFKRWGEWSPWLIHDPDAAVSYSDDHDQEGGHYSWDGQYIGAGRLTHVRLERPQRIAQRIEFVRPFKSTAAVAFALQARDGQTEISWSMDGAVPFFLRFMTRTLKPMLARDYALGLARLAGVIDPAAAHPEPRIIGEVWLAARRCLCREFTGGKADMVAAMSEGFPKLLQHIRDNQAEVSAYPMSVYHKVNMKADSFQCDIAIPTDSDLPAGDYVFKEVAGGRFLKIVMQGSYDFLELGWHIAYCHVQMRKYKVDGSRAALEVYETDPNQVGSENELITSLYLPLR